LKRKAKAAGAAGWTWCITERIKESEMYNLGVMHGQQKMREKMLKQLDHLIEEIRNDY